MIDAKHRETGRGPVLPLHVYQPFLQFPGIVQGKPAVARSSVNTTLMSAFTPCVIETAHISQCEGWSFLHLKMPSLLLIVFKFYVWLTLHAYWMSPPVKTLHLNRRILQGCSWSFHYQIIYKLLTLLNNHELPLKTSTTPNEHVGKFRILLETVWNSLKRGISFSFLQLCQMLMFTLARALARLHKYLQAFPRFRVSVAGTHLKNFTSESPECSQL